MGGSALFYLCLALGLASAASDSSGGSDAVEPPRLVGPPLDLRIPAQSGLDAVQVKLILTINKRGEVVEVQDLPLASTHYDWLLARLLSLTFIPAAQTGEALAVRVPLQLELESSRIPKAQVVWQVFEEGSSRRLRDVSVRVYSGELEIASATTGEDGRVEMALEAFDSLQVVVESDGYLALVSSFEAAAQASLAFDIMLLPESAFGGYRQVVRGKRERTGSRLVLTQKELTHVAGSLNDPFRTIQTLPGVSNVSSVYPLPVVRGTGPNHSAVWIDGFLAPLVFHFLAGPSVIYPELLQSISYESGDAGVQYGGQIGGIISAQTGFDLTQEADVAEGNLNLAQAGALVRREYGDGVWLASGRIGYPGYLLRLAGTNLELSYWDYHGQWSETQGRTRQRVALYGAGDSFMAETGLAPLRLQFHRLLYEYASEGLKLGSMTELSTSSLPDQPEELTTGALGVNLNYRWVFSDDWIVDSGLQSKLSFDDVDVNQAVVDAIAAQYVDERPPGYGPGDESLGNGESNLPEEDFLKDAEAWRGQHSAYLSTELRIPTVGLVIAPGVRYDFVHQRENTLDAWNARVRLKQKLFATPDLKLHLKASTGLFSQPPRVPLIIPGLDFGLLNLGMQKAWRSSMGLSLERDVWRYSLTGFFSRMTNLSLDWGMVDETGEIPIAVEGRAYGVELFVRRLRTQGLFGWLSYTWSRSTRNWGTGWRWFTLDREHVANLVMGFELERGWGISARVLYQSGTPQTPEFYPLEDTERGASFTRFDIRFDRRVVYPTWALEFYVDIGNALVAAETFGEEDEDAPGYVLPMIGLRARF